MPSDGEQSISTTSYLSRTGANNLRNLCSLAISETKAASAAARSSWPRMKSKPGTVDFKMKSSNFASESLSKYQIDPYCSRRAAPLIPSPVVIDACESKSMSKTRRPVSAKAAPKLIAVVVLPTPPFWLTTEITLADAVSVTFGGSGKFLIFRPSTSAVVARPSSRILDLVGVNVDLTF